MKKHKSLLILLVLITLFLSGCGDAFSRATPTLTATNTPQPTATAVPANTVTPTLAPTPTNMPSKGYFDSDTYYVPMGGYSFQMPKDHEPWDELSLDINYEETTIESDDGNFEVWISIIQARDVYSFESFTQEFVVQFTKMNPEFLFMDPSKTIWVNETEGRDLIFYENEEPGNTLIDCVFLNGGPGRYIALRFTISGNPLSVEPLEGYVSVMDQILESFQVHEPIYAAQADCAMGKNTNYGYDIENPIFVGGGSFLGRTRIENYLDNLLGPNGELVGSTLVRSFTYGDLMIVECELTYLGLEEPITLYLSVTHRTALYVPIGFSCKQPFPQVEP